MADKPSRQLSADDVLPPVEPPSAAFLVQLFLVPGLIVAIIVCVWLAFHWLAHLGNDPQAYVRTLRRANEGRWQAALTPEPREGGRCTSARSYAAATCGGRSTRRRSPGRRARSASPSDSSRRA